MNPTGLPELSKPLRDLNFDQKREQLKFQNFEKFQKIEKIVTTICCLAYVSILFLFLILFTGSNVQRTLEADIIVPERFRY